MDELDRILGSDEGLEPSSGFTRRVMEAVEQEKQAPPPIPFPWLRLLPALFGAVGIVGAFAFSLATEPFGPTPGMANWLEHPLVAPLGWAALSLIGSWVAVRLSMRLAAPSR